MNNTVVISLAHVGQGGTTSLLLPGQAAPVYNVVDRTWETELELRRWAAEFELVGGRPTILNCDGKVAVDGDLLPEPGFRKVIRNHDDLPIVGDAASWTRREGNLAEWGPAMPSGCWASAAVATRTLAAPKGWPMPALGPVAKTGDPAQGWRPVNTPKGRGWFKPLIPLPIGGYGSFLDAHQAVREAVELAAVELVTVRNIRTLWCGWAHSTDPHRTGELLPIGDYAGLGGWASAAAVAGIALCDAAPEAVVVDMEVQSLHEADQLAALAMLRGHWDKFCAASAAVQQPVIA